MIKKYIIYTPILFLTHYTQTMEQKFKTICIQTKNIEAPKKLDRPHKPITELLQSPKEQIRLLLCYLCNDKDLKVCKLNYFPRKTFIKIHHQSTYPNDKLIQCLKKIVEQEIVVPHISGVKPYITYIGQKEPPFYQSTEVYGSMSYRCSTKEYTLPKSGCIIL